MINTAIRNLIEMIKYFVKRNTFTYYLGIESDCVILFDNIYFDYHRFDIDQCQDHRWRWDHYCPMPKVWSRHQCPQALLHT